MTSETPTLVEREFIQLEKESAWNSLYIAIRNKTSSYGHSLHEAKKLSNKNLNRYRDVSPYDHSRVILGKGNCDYINASLVKVSAANREYILTQGPLPETTGHFWLMVWEQKTRAIVMLNKIIEKDQVKCHHYWVEDEANPLMLLEEGLRVEFLDQSEQGDFITRKFKLTDIEKGISREVFQFHFVTWPDFGVPSSPESFLHFLEFVRGTGTLDLGPETGPPVVHCSAGIGRSGTFCLVDSCLIMLKKDNGPTSVSVQQLLLDMRHYRMGLIQTPEQLRFSYLSILEALIEMREKGELPMSLEIEMENGSDDYPLSGESDIEEETPPSVVNAPPPLPPRNQSLSFSPPSASQEEEEAPISSKPLPSLPDGEESSEDDSDDTDIDEALPESDVIAIIDEPIEVFEESRKRKDEATEANTNSKKCRQETSETAGEVGNGEVPKLDEPLVPEEASTLHQESGPKVRQRRKENQKIQEKVNEIKKNMADAERRESRRKFFLNPYSIAFGGFLLLLSGTVVYKYFS